MTEGRTPASVGTPATRATVYTSGISPGVGFVLLVLGLLLLAKLLLAINTDLFLDEAFYWQEAQRPDLAYADHPFMTAGLVWLGTMLLGDTPLGVRLIFLVLGSCLPFAVYWLASPLVPARRDAVLAAAATLILPLAATLGMIAIPDVPLVLCLTLALAAFERATRSDNMRYWLAVGVLCALGFATHYRFVLFPAAALLYLLFSRRGRRCLVSRGVWIAAGLMLLGLLPVLIYNLLHDFEPFKYQFLQRHPWSFSGKALLSFVQQQAMVVTPLLLLTLLTVLASLLYKAWRGDDRAALVACFSLVYLGVFALASPWADRDHTSLHWPLAGYIPLLVFLPVALRRLSAMFPYRAAGKILAGIVIATGALGTVAVLVVGAGNTLMERIYPMLPSAYISPNAAGWNTLGQRVSQLIQTMELPQPPLVVTDKNESGSQLEFLLSDSDVFTINSSGINFDGRAHQYVLWGMDEETLRRTRAGRDALVVIDETPRRRFSHEQTVRHFCGLFVKLTPLGHLSQLGGHRRFGFYRGHEVLPPDTPNGGVVGTAQSSCPLPSVIGIDPFPKNKRISGDLTISGWAFNNAGGVSTVEVLIDGMPVRHLRYGGNRPDVRKFYPDMIDPNDPRIGFRGKLETSKLTAGPHWISLRVTGTAGTVTEYGAHRIFVESP
jgi:4-amino-4-deoxy-L-arabinose transferase-like glycosyltransferase